MVEFISETLKRITPQSGSQQTTLSVIIVIKEEIKYEKLVNSNEKVSEQSGII